MSLLTFENDKTDTFNLDKAYLLDVRDVNGFVLCIDNSLSFTQNAATLLNFGIRDNWLVTFVTSAAVCFFCAERFVGVLKSKLMVQFAIIRLARVFILVLILMRLMLTISYLYVLTLILVFSG